MKEEDKFHIVLVNRPIENFGKLLKDESEVCVLCVHRDVDFLKDIGLMEVSRMSTGDKHFSLLYRVSVIATRDSGSCVLSIDKVAKTFV